MQVTLKAATLKPNMGSFFSYDSYVVLELAPISVLTDKMGQGYWSKEAFGEARGKTQGGIKSSVIKDSNNPDYNEAAPCTSGGMSA